ncbi:MAG: hypothetical protein JW892_05995 [Anaerolineae bacterium]|nr:hypothetical protein [Anaerolineae bacterium]
MGCRSDCARSLPCADPSRFFGRADTAQWRGLRACLACFPR